MTEWLETLRALPEGLPAVLITVLATEGSAPRGAGTRMVVTGEGAAGTIGGGKLEHGAIGQARAVLSLPPGSWRIQDYPLGPLLGQCCGGRVRLLIEHVDRTRLDWLDDVATGAAPLVTLMPTHVERRSGGETQPPFPLARGERPEAGACFTEPAPAPRRPVYLFGAGHVGQAVARHAERLPFQLAWFDTRPGFDRHPGVTLIDEREIEACVEAAPEDAAIVILTHDHGLDYRLLHAALSRRPVAYTGLIGSATKRARFLARLERDALSAKARERLVCPIGVDGVRGKEPDVIAIAVLAQLLQLCQPADAPPLSRGCGG